MAGTYIKTKVENPFTRAFENYFDKVEDKISARERDTLMKLNEKILARTPVWEGDTIANWRWSTRAPSNEHTPPRGSGIPTGATNSMALGEEPRRRVNEARPRRSLAAALRAKLPENIYLTNTSDSAISLEYGLLPTPSKSRVDARGIVRLSIAEIKAGI